METTTPSNTFEGYTPVITGIRLRGSDSDFNHTITASRSTQQIQLEHNKLSFWLRESRLLFVGVISLLVIAVAASIIILINDCSVNSACFSLISAIVGGWLSLLTRQKLK